eukprot:TRINITY_DN31510_c0_g1_i1.p1 TRINITY_DN31510_c0_g1~~TRINITY_DN31510_c0_g1_i1.p1  ORF type:complete len:486 (-),score=142.38 TRINITY_DN31510_c0_g1_i1:77-1534(-)
MITRWLAVTLFAAFLEAPGADEGTCKLPTWTSGSATPRRGVQKFQDIVGLTSAKAVLQEALIAPLTSPLISGDVLQRVFWRSSAGKAAILLVGPAGMGKASLVEAAAAVCDARLLHVRAADVVSKAGFCEGVVQSAASAAAAGDAVKQQPLVVLVEALEAAPSAGAVIRSCLRLVAEAEPPRRVAFVATMSRTARRLQPAHRAPFGYVAHVAVPEPEERKQYLLELFAEVSKVDAKWASALQEAAISELANVTDRLTFGELDMIVRRAFLRSSLASGDAVGERDPVALHHFEQIVAETQGVLAVRAFEDDDAAVDDEPAGEAEEGVKRPARSGADADEKDEKTAGDTNRKKKKSKKKKDSRSPMDGFGWCNFFLPEALHLPPIVWAMILFGILAHLMARSTYKPYGKKGRGGGRGSMFTESDRSGSDGYPFLGGGGAFGGFPSAPGLSGDGGADVFAGAMGGMPGMGGGGMAAGMGAAFGGLGGE